MKKLKILQVNKLYYPAVGGIERVVRQLAEGLNDRTDMTVLACRPRGKGFTENINGVEVRKAGSMGTLFSVPVSLPFFYWFNRMKKNRDILHIHMPFPLADVAVLLFGFNGKVVLWWHSDVVRQKRLLALYRPFMHGLLKRADLIITATEGHISGSDYLPEYRGKCAVIPYGVDTALLEKNEGVPTRLRLPGAPVRFLFTGRLIYYKGCHVLLEAFARVHGAELVLVGDGPLGPQLKEQAERLGISGLVRFYGSVSDEELSGEFDSCDVFVLPSVAKSEAFGLVQIEAMVYSKPVINTSLPGGVPWVSLDGETGITVPPNNVEALAKAMQTLVDHPDLRIRFGKAAYARAHSEFSMDKMLDRVMEQYTELTRK